MISKVNEFVSVSLAYDAKAQKITPKWIEWNGRLYPVIRVGLHHTLRQGRTLYHVFSVVSKTLFFKLILNTDTLHWKLDQISDGLPD